MSTCESYAVMTHSLGSDLVTFILDILLWLSYAGWPPDGHYLNKMIVMVMMMMMMVMCVKGCVDTIEQVECVI